MLRKSQRPPLFPLLEASRLGKPRLVIPLGLTVSCRFFISLFQRFIKKVYEGIVSKPLRFLWLEIFSRCLVHHFIHIFPTKFILTCLVFLETLSSPLKSEMHFCGFEQCYTEQLEFVMTEPAAGRSKQRLKSKSTKVCESLYVSVVLGGFSWF